MQHINVQLGELSQSENSWKHCPNWNPASTQSTPDCHPFPYTEGSISLTFMEVAALLLKDSHFQLNMFPKH